MAKIDKALREAFELFAIAATLPPTKRLELYYENGNFIRSDVLSEGESTPDGKTLCYRIDGSDALEAEIVAWIDHARHDENPSALAHSIQECESDLATAKNIDKKSISSYEIVANLSMEVLSGIEQEITQFWWEKPDDGGLALAKEAIQNILD